MYSSKPEQSAVDESSENVAVAKKERSNYEQLKASIPPNTRFVYPEFLPDPNMKYRHPIKEKIEREDMLNRRYVGTNNPKFIESDIKLVFSPSRTFRKHIDIPEFYVGTIMAVTVSDKHSVGKTTRFVGICIERGGTGLLSFFILRNAIDHQGIEIKYMLYDPTIQKIEILRLEKRLDENLRYLRDAPLEYSTFDLNMEAKHHPEGEPVPVNPIQVTLRPRPW